MEPVCSRMMKERVASGARAQAAEREVKVRNGQLGAEPDRGGTCGQPKNPSGCKGTPVAEVVVHDPDPFAHLTPAERYAQAIQRRDSMKSANMPSLKSSL